MALNHKRFTLEQVAEAGLISLLKQSFPVFVALLVMLLLTGGNPSSFVVGLNFSLGIVFVAWSEIQRLTDPKQVSNVQKNISRVDLDGSDLRGANLSDSDLIHANLYATATSLIYGLLSGGNLSGANLISAKLNIAIDKV